MQQISWGRYQKAHCTCSKLLQQFQQQVLRLVDQVRALDDQASKAQVAVEDGADQFALVLLPHVVDANHFRQKFWKMEKIAVFF